MASAALTNFQNLMTEVMQNEQLVFGFETPLLRLVTGMSQDANYVMTRDPNRERATPMNVGKDQFHGKKVTQPLLLNEVSSGSLGEGSTFLVPGVIDTAQATYNLIDRNTIIGLSIDAMRDTENGSSSAIKATTMYIQSAYRFHARTDNDYLHGSAVGTSATNGLLCNVSSNVGSAGLTIPVAGANMDQLTIGRVITILTRSTGADPGNGNRRKITAVDRTAGAETITVDTNAYASDGDSGNVTFSNLEGIYIDSPTTGTQTAPFGVGSICATSGTVGGLDKATVTQWKGQSVDAGSAVLADDHLDTASYLLRGVGVGAADFGIAHPLTVDAYKATKISLGKYDIAQNKTFPSGLQGIVYQGADKEIPILKDLAAPRKKCRLLTLDSFRLFSDRPGNGPSFLNNDGTEWRFVTRNAVMESWLYDRWQTVAKDCGKNCEIINASE